MVVTQHSGDGKANQYFLRGMNLDHGTDLALWLDGMPLNMRTHGHGQGYADVNFLIPELVSSMLVRKGPYWAQEGDFASAGTLRLDYAHRLDRNILSVTGGSYGYWRGLAAGSMLLGDGTLTGAGEIVRYDGPWVVPDSTRKYNGVLRYTEGSVQNGFSLTAMAYTNSWHSTDQIPQRAWLDGSLDGLRRHRQQTFLQCDTHEVHVHRSVVAEMFTDEACRIDTHLFASAGAKAFVELRQQVIDATAAYVSDVQSGVWPDDAHSFH